MAGDIPFNRELDFEYRAVSELTPLIRRVVAENPSAFTLYGTGTYIIGRGQVAIIDPGPAMDDHVDALLQAVAGEQVSHLLITHTHIDHSPAAKAVQQRTGATTYGFGPHGGGRDGPQVEEGGDHSFTPDVAIGDGDVIAGPGWTVEAVHTPGHTSNHLCFALAEADVLFSGDHVMGWSTTVVSPPDGDMTAYMASLDKLLARDDGRYWPTHGPAIDQPQDYVQAYKRHRHAREAALLASLKSGAKAIPDMVAEIYAEVPKHLHGAAGRSVLAHLIHLNREGRVNCDGDPAAASIFYL